MGQRIDPLSSIKTRGRSWTNKQRRTIWEYHRNVRAFCYPQNDVDVKTGLSGPLRGVHLTGNHMQFARL